MAHRSARSTRGSAARFVVRPLVAALAAAGVIGGSGVRAATIVVSDGGDSGTASTCTLRQAVVAMNTASLAGTTCVNSGGAFGSSDLVDLSAQTGTIALSGTEIPITVNLVVDGGSAVTPPPLTVSGANLSRVFSSQGAPIIGITVSRLIVANGRSQGPGGCIYGEGHVQLFDSIVTGCTAVHDPANTSTVDGLGGGVATYALYALNSTIRGNTARNGGGGVFAYVQTLYNVAITGNTVTGQACDATESSKYCIGTIFGGGGSLGASVLMAGSTVSGNTVQASAITITNGETTQTVEIGMGGGISQFYTYGEKYAPVVVDAKSTVTGVRILGHTGREARHAARLAVRPATSKASALSTRSAAGARPKADGYADYVLAMRNSTVSGNRVVGSGGNEAKYAGGGAIALSKYGSAEIANSTISGNSVGSGPNSLGSGLYADSVEISNSTITANSGAMALAIGGEEVNPVNRTKRGAALPPGLAAIRAAVVHARAPGASAKARMKADVPSFIESTIVAGNSGGPDIDCNSPCAIGGSNNLVRSFGVDVTLPPGTIVGQSAQLAPLANNGGIVAGAPGDPGTGPVRTHRLYLGSPAIDQGVNNEGFNYEQRGPGYPRVVGPAADIGATEGAIQPPPQAVAAPVPALGPWMLGLLSALLAALGLARRRRTP
ncbi:MAG: IPTL-CTERM sorting domain-containing protein [Burkholderiales bacterium]|jgi:hypothetical protein|nr:IPTL-CTERM sorting domain-containing protein [Burkholderiales bacterium]